MAFSRTSSPYFAQWKDLDSVGRIRELTSYFRRRRKTSKVERGSAQRYSETRKKKVDRIDATLSLRGAYKERSAVLNPSIARRTAKRSERDQRILNDDAINSIKTQRRSLR